MSPIISTIRWIRRLAAMMIALLVIASGARTIPPCGFAQIVPFLIFAPLCAMMLQAAIWSLLCRLVGWNQEEDIAFDDDGKPAPRILGTLFMGFISIAVLAALTQEPCIEFF